MENSSWLLILRTIEIFLISSLKIMKEKYDLLLEEEIRICVMGAIFYFQELSL